MGYINKIELTLIREKIEDYNASDKIHSSRDAYLYFKRLSKFPQEELHALYINTKSEIIGICQIHKGTQNKCGVNAADIIRPALLCGATGILIAHNHPSGDCNPSNEDLAITGKIKNACKIMGINLLDHIIIGDNKFYSIKKKHFQKGKCNEMSRMR